MQAAFWISFLISVSITFPGSRAINMMTLHDNITAIIYVYTYIDTHVYIAWYFINKRETIYVLCHSVPCIQIDAYRRVWVNRRWSMSNDFIQFR